MPFPRANAAAIRLAMAAVAVAAGARALAAPGLEIELPAVRDAALRGNLKAVEAARARFAGHPLEAYPSYWMLAGGLERADRGAIQDFLARYPGTPLAESLRREWLKVLGATGQWDIFRAEHPKLAAEDAEVACYALQERAARGDPDVAAEARTLFISGRETPGACDPVFAALFAGGAIAADDVTRRVRRLLAANSVSGAKRAGALLPPRERLDEKRLDKAAADPSRFLAREVKSAVLTRNEREIALFAIARLARSRPEEAAEQLVALAPRLGPDLTRFAWAQVAPHAAMAHHPRALDFYGEAADTMLTDAQVAWKARAALRAGSWKDVLLAIQGLTPEEARDASWRYWRARALRELGEAEPARALLRGVAAERGFYGILAAEELGIATPPDWNGWKPQPADLERVAALPGVQRALALYRADLDNEALREWSWAIRHLDDRDLLAAAELARQAGEPDRAINTAGRTVQLHDLAQRYPMPHREAVSAAARQWGLDEALLYAIIRQESRFMAHARSRTGAAGLMQLMPATARWVARQIPVNPYRADMLVLPEVNVQMGTFYLNHVLADLGHPVLAAAAYNAGPGRARRWRDARALDGAIYVETIPFNETRDYVKQVFANAWHYGHRLHGQPPSLRAWVGQVPGRDGLDPALASTRP